MSPFTPDDARELARSAHAGQTDKPPATRYAEAGPTLFAAVVRDDAEKILRRINPSLTPELG